MTSSRVGPPRCETTCMSAMRLRSRSRERGERQGEEEVGEGLFLFKGCFYGEGQSGP